jgi:hypothetical protein
MENKHHAIKKPHLGGVLDVVLEQRAFQQQRQI